MTPSSDELTPGEPGLRLAQIAREGRKRDACMRARKKCLERRSALFERPFEKGLARLAQQAIEGDKDGGRFLRQSADAALGRMQAHLQRVEREIALDRNHELAIEHELRRRQRAQVVENFGKEARQRFPRLGFDLHRVRGAERQAAKAVPFGLELPAGLLLAAPRPALLPSVRG